MQMKTFVRDAVPTVMPQDVLGDGNVTLIDVRRPEEYVGELGHVPGAQLVTLGPELDSFLRLTSKDATIVFICRSGGRSGKATVEALALGLENAYNMEGGMLAWNELKLPTQRNLITPS